VIEMPPVVLENGNIRLHVQEGLQIPLQFTDDEGERRDVSTSAMFFEVHAGGTKHRWPLITGVELDEMWLQVPPGALDFLLGKRGDFIFIDESTESPIVFWEGNIMVVGWK